MGPALPSRLSEPPPRTLAEIEKGKTEVSEKSRNSALSFSRTSGLRRLPVLPNVNRPPVIFTSLTERSSPFSSAVSYTHLTPADERSSVDLGGRRIIKK